MDSSSSSPLYLIRPPERFFSPSFKGNVGGGDWELGNHNYEQTTHHHNLLNIRPCNSILALASATWASNGWRRMFSGCSAAAFDTYHYHLRLRLGGAPHDKRCYIIVLAPRFTLRSRSSRSRFTGCSDWFDAKGAQEWSIPIWCTLNKINNSYRVIQLPQMCSRSSHSAIHRVQ